MALGMRKDCPANLICEIAEPGVGAANFVLGVWLGFTGTADVIPGGKGVCVPGAAAGTVACACRLFSAEGAAFGSLAKGLDCPLSVPGTYVGPVGRVVMCSPMLKPAACPS